ncbi:hypothetical protein CO669_16585 [Bradyrhizobium sp. Y36]|uniref:hypothetical protein n=1 Tax=Bradyrhizobium sp. Y36 TaxID=2035447 RepID=UPI000BEADDFF|nr:hypothetical protein [Bradyrhizobium sp. Y36]PDT89178.1 hypothetical protein CO669_16585 [Bradyrhizobium sp. Y36]
MTPKAYFDDVWNRADLFVTLHAYFMNNVAPVVQSDDLLRAEWAMRVSALDLYVHEVVAQNLLKIFQGARPVCPGYSKLQISSDTLMRIHASGPGHASDTAFDLEIRTRLARATYQFPDDIADGIRMVSPIELWNEIVRHHGAAAPAIVKVQASALKGELTQVVNRRNKIVHEGDLQPGIPRTPWTITRQDVDEVKAVIEKIVTGIEAKV